MSVPSGRPLGLSVASHSGLAPAAVGEVAASAEAAGFSAVFVAEGHGDALSLCHPVIAATRQARVGTAVANAALRPPVLAAKTAAQLDQASGGRFLLGLGVANEVMNSRFGLPSVPPLPMIAEYAAVVRAVLAGQEYAGTLFRAGLVPLDSPPARQVPVYLAALGPRMLELAGRIADGVILNLMSPAQAGEAADMVRAAAERPAGIRQPSRSRASCIPACPPIPRPRLLLPGPWCRATSCTRQPRGCSARSACPRSPSGYWLATGRARRRPCLTTSPRRLSRPETPPRAPRGRSSTGRPASTCPCCSRCPSAATGPTNR